VTIQAQILDIIRSLVAELGTAVVLITHDLGVVADMADRVEVMYAGHRVESAPVDELFAAPRHPYTKRLLAAVPRPDRSGGRLREIPGRVPTLRGEPASCVFHPRCARASDECRAEVPPLRGSGRLVACFHPEGEPA
jgi:peptide/nickel transport system ATP-binding protein